MPIWDVVCTKCEEKEEIIVSHSQEIPVCKCGSERVKLPSASGIRFVGMYTAATGYSECGAIEDEITKTGNRV